jgi:hypothetical protein
MNVTSWSSFDQMFDNTNQPSKKRRKTRSKKDTSETNSKNKKPKEKTTFTLTSLPVTEHISEEDIPELMQHLLFRINLPRKS